MAFPRASGLGARLLRGRLRTVTPQRPVPFPSQGPPLRPPLTIYGRYLHQAREWCLGSLELHPFQGSDQVYFSHLCRNMPELFLLILLCVQSRAPVRIPGSLFPIPCVLPPGLVGWGKGCPRRGGGAACALREGKPTPSIPLPVLLSPPRRDLFGDPGTFRGSVKVNLLMLGLGSGLFSLALRMAHFTSPRSFFPAQLPLPSTLQFCVCGFIYLLAPSLREHRGQSSNENSGGETQLGPGSLRSSTKAFNVAWTWNGQVTAGWDGSGEGRRIKNRAVQGGTKNEGSRLIFWPVVAGTGLLFLRVQPFGLVEYPWLCSNTPVNPVFPGSLSPQAPPEGAPA
ncbi:uncharacterized protein LOC118581948 [Onychomys torridus]|uniref:uncharacterized protein LOC118581948 n=1 Tax=Onychomys torridus TaxID=38674 RepID=UPI00167FD2DC|nr:uncharacterized protein LOC118581948 [Onychomys torridus]